MAAPRQLKPVPSTPGPRWISIRRACEILGVTQATLRHWSDSGRVRAYITPGGHRRYAEQELLAMTAEPAAGDLPALEALMMRSRDGYGQLVRQRLGGRPWFQQFDGEARLRFRVIGNSMLNLMASYVLADAQRERRRGLDEGREVAAQYGREAADLGLSLRDTTEAFLVFRGPVLESVHQWLDAQRARSFHPTHVLGRVNEFMDQVLINLAAAHEQRQREHRDTSTPAPPPKPEDGAADVVY